MWSVESRGNMHLQMGNLGADFIAEGVIDRLWVNDFKLGLVAQPGELTHSFV